MYLCQVTHAALTFVATSADLAFFQWFQGMQETFVGKLGMNILWARYDRSGIRTRATEVTGALNQRLRPLGHPA